MAEDKLCECFRPFARVITFITEAIDSALDHEFSDAEHDVTVAMDDLTEFEKCTALPLPFRRSWRELKIAIEELREDKDFGATVALKSAQRYLLLDVDQLLCKRVEKV